jgi:hypothetical protein
MGAWLHGRVRNGLLRSGLACCVLGACNGSADKGIEEEDEYAPYKAVVFPDELQSRDTAFAIRLTNTSAATTEVHESLVALAQQFDIVSALTRGGVPVGGVGAGGASSDPGAHPDLLAGTAVEQARAYFERTRVDKLGIFPSADAVDACGNPVIAAFITPDQLQHVATGDPTAEPVWPDGCTGPDCNDLTLGTLDVYLTETRPNDMTDMVITLYADTTTNPPIPALFGHVLGFFVSDNNPGYTEMPMVINAKQFTVVLANLWQRQKVYADLKGAREIYAFPQSARTVYPDEVLAVVSANTPKHCKAAWAATGQGGQDPFGCDQSQGLVLDRNGLAGAEIYSRYMEDGANFNNLTQLTTAFSYQLQAYAACPAVTDGGYYQHGPVELFVCPPDAGSVDVCVASVDMEQGVCTLEEGGFDPVVPVNQATPVVLVPQRYPYVLRGNDPLAPIDTGNPVVPFSGSKVTVELTVEADTVLFLTDSSVIERIVDSLGEPVELPAESNPCVVDTTDTTGTTGTVDLPERFDVGEVWPPGTYTVTMPWRAAAADYTVGLTSVTAWIF